MSNALYIKTATKKPLTSGLNAFMSRKRCGYLRMYLAINFFAFCGYVANFFGGTTHAKDAAYNHSKVYDVCSFHSG